MAASSTTRRVRLAGGAVIHVDDSPAVRCTGCRRLRHFVIGGLCPDCRRERLPHGPQA